MVKSPPANAGEVGSVPELRGYLGEGNGNPLHYCFPENPMDRESGRLQSMGSESNTT